jgi:beta-glucosidase
MNNYPIPFIENLLNQMTVDEKIGQLNQIHPFEDFNIDSVRQCKVGSIINASDALAGQGSSASISVEVANTLQQAALDTRLKIPLIFGRDVIHGYRTVFPIPLAQAAAFDPALTQQAASVAALEATACGIKWTFAPMLDIARDPRWGRVAEGNGEDPYLGSQLAYHLIKGFQGDDMAQPGKLVACAKHYVGYGSAEGGRDYDSGEISEPTLRDVYLPPFRSAISAGVGTIMSAFLDLNGIPATANRHLLTKVLRDEWGFDGFVVSDWESIAELIAHGVADDRAEAACLALHAGVDMDMVSQVYLDALSTCLQNGSISPVELDEAVRRVLRLKHRAGLFDHPFTDPTRFSHDVLTDNSRQLARQFARQTMVLLKNENQVLPLSGYHKLLIAGDFIDARAELFGTWSPDGRPEDVQPLQQAFTDLAPKGMELWFADNIEQALVYALQVDAILLLLGEHPRRSGENANLSDLTLSPAQAHLVDLMVSMGKPVVLVVFAGRPLVLTRQMGQVDALLYAWHPGIEGAAALAEVLFGIHSPSGRLAITFPRATGQVPVYYNHKNSGRPVSVEGEFKSRYLDLPTSPLFPFGFGLSYTSFDYANIQLSQEVFHDELAVSVEVTNRGSRPGSELVQLYLRDLVGSLTRPVCQLAGFQHLQLQPGETRCLSFNITEPMLAFTRADGSWGTEPGRFQVWVGPHSAAGLCGEFRL